jgi:hypothetical protein
VGRSYAAIFDGHNGAGAAETAGKQALVVCLPCQPGVRLFAGLAPWDHASCLLACMCVVIFNVFCCACRSCLALLAQPRCCCALSGNALPQDSRGVTCCRTPAAYSAYAASAGPLELCQLHPAPATV